MTILPKLVTTVVQIYTTDWTDITPYVVSDIEAEQGMVDDSYDTRLADPATVMLTLNNKDGSFTPSATFGKGTLLRIRVSYDGKTKTKFYGTIDELDIEAGTTGDERVSLTCTDWLNYAINEYVKEQSVQVNKRMDEGIRGLLAQSPIQPLSTLIDNGSTTFPTIYDQIDRNTTLYRELNNFIMSEYGYGYMDRGGERFRVENKNARAGVTELAVLPIASDGSALKKADGDYLLKMDGGKILLNSSQTADFDMTVNPNYIQSMKVLNGKHVLNEVEFVVFPKRVDASNVQLFALDEPIFIPALATVTIEGYYSDPRSGDPCTATSQVTPVATTDYTAFANSDGSGTNYTSNITITSTFYADRWIASIYNAGVGAWMNFLRLRGIGIYADNPIATVVEDTTSKETYGVRNLSIRQPYQQSVDLGRNEGSDILDKEKDPRNVITNATFVAQASDLNMQAFLHLDIGELIHIKTTMPAIDSNFYVNGTRWKIDHDTGYIYYTYILKENPTLTMIAVEFSKTANSQHGIDYGNPSVLNGVTDTTYFMRIYQKDATNQFCPLFGKYAGLFQKCITMSNTGKLAWRVGFTSAYGVWNTNNEVMDSYIDEWTTIAVTYSSSSTANDPVIYVNGAAVAITEESAPVGSPAPDEVLVNFILNNSSYPAAYFAYNSDIVTKDYRVYNRILSADEIAALDANDDPDYNTTGLIFQAPFVRTYKLADYLGAITTDERLFDRINKIAGIPHYNTPSIIGHEASETSF